MWQSPERGLSGALFSLIQLNDQRCGVVTLFRYRERPAAGGGRWRHAEHSVSGDGCGRANERSLSVGSLVSNNTSSTDSDLSFARLRPLLLVGALPACGPVPVVTPVARVHTVRTQLR